MDCILILPEDKETKKCLRTKLNEYKERSKEKDRSEYYKEDAKVKIAIIEALFKNKTIKSEDLFRELAGKNKKFDPYDRFNESFQIISGYCKTAVTSTNSNSHK
jgi:hypothetical protein